MTFTIVIIMFKKAVIIKYILKTKEQLFLLTSHSCTKIPLGYKAKSAKRKVIGSERKCRSEYNRCR